ncbi:MAG: hypothetical protein V8Q57_04270 [Blautia sp.]
MMCTVDFCFQALCILLLLLCQKEVSQYTVTLYSTSKTYNTAGLRHSFVITENPEIYKKYREFLTAISMEYGQNLMGIEATIAAFNECDGWLETLMEEISR